jgi:hypothetical protein
MSEYSKHRKFIHDISNGLAIVEGGIRRNQKLLQDCVVPAEVEENAKAAIKAIGDAILSLKEFRSFIHQLEKTE